MRVEPQAAVRVEHDLGHVGIEECTDNRFSEFPPQLLLKASSLQWMDADHDCSVSMIALGSPPPARRYVSTERSQESWRRMALRSAASLNSGSTSGVCAR